MSTFLPAFRPLLRILAAGLAFVSISLLSRATSVVPPSFEELVNQSDYVVHAVVKSVTAELRTAPSGNQVIHSRVELEVKEIVAGQPPATVVLDVLGGRLGDRELSIEGAPKFTAGEEAVFFVQGNGTQIYPLTRMMHGVYPVLKDAANRAYIARSNGAPLHDVSEVSQPAEGSVHATSVDAGSALTPADFIQKIRATVRTNSAAK